MSPNKDRNSQMEVKKALVEAYFGNSVMLLQCFACRRLKVQRLLLQNRKKIDVFVQLQRRNEKVSLCKYRHFRLQ